MDDKLPLLGVWVSVQERRFTWQQRRDFEEEVDLVLYLVMNERGLCTYMQFSKRVLKVKYFRFINFTRLGTVAFAQQDGQKPATLWMWLVIGQAICPVRFGQHSTTPRHIWLQNWYWTNRHRGAPTLYSTGLGYNDYPLSRLIFIRGNNRWGDDATRVGGKRHYKTEQVVY
jgi:hypothetical protein